MTLNLCHIHLRTWNKWPLRLNHKVLGESPLLPRGAPYMVMSICVLKNSSSLLQEEMSGASVAPPSSSICLGQWLEELSLNQLK